MSTSFGNFHDLESPGILKNFVPLSMLYEHAELGFFCSMTVIFFTCYNIMFTLHSKPQFSIWINVTVKTVQACPSFETLIGNSEVEKETCY